MKKRSLSEQMFLVLTALAAEPMHGYGILQAANKLSDAEVTLRVSTLYGVLDRLCTEGFAAPDREEIHSGRVRRYYRITDAGTAELVRDADWRARTAPVALERARPATGGLAAGLVGEVGA